MFERTSICFTIVIIYSLQVKNKIIRTKNRTIYSTIIIQEMLFCKEMLLRIFQIIIRKLYRNLKIIFVNNFSRCFIGL